MGLEWKDCFLCQYNGVSKGRIDIGANFNKFFKVKNIICPLCKGKKRIAVKKLLFNPWFKRKGDN